MAEAESKREVPFREVARKFVEESAEPTEECSGCKWYAMCRGGCRRYRQPDAGGALGQSSLCRAYEIFFESCGDRILALARMLKNRS